MKTSHSRNCDSDDLLQQEDKTRTHKPLPEVGTVDHEKRPDPHVGQVRPVKDLVDKKFGLVLVIAAVTLRKHKGEPLAPEKRLCFTLDYRIIE